MLSPQSLHGKGSAYDGDNGSCVVEQFDKLEGREVKSQATEDGSRCESKHRGSPEEAKAPPGHEACCKRLVHSWILRIEDFRRKKHKGGELDYLWQGPFIITATLGKGLYRLKEVNGNKVRFNEY